jgi:two-component system response regulator YesN
LENKLVEQIKMGTLESAKDLADDIFSYIISNTCKVEYIKECLTEFFTVLKRTVVKLGANFFAFGVSGIVNDLSVLNDIDEINIWYKTNVSNLLDVIENKSLKNKEVINTALEYINKYFTGDITLESVADEVGISPQYLSKIFKEKYGSNFIDYITAKRMEYAQELLSKKDASIKDVSKAVGYGDPYYFSKVFKKDIGLTPKQYHTQKIIGGMR